MLAEGEERRDYYGNEEAPNQSSDRGEFLIDCTLCLVQTRSEDNSIGDGTMEHI